MNNMKALIIAWALSFAVLLGGGAYLWYAQIPVVQAAPAEVIFKVDTRPQVLTTGPLAIDATASAGDEDCLGTC